MISIKLFASPFSIDEKNYQLNLIIFFINNCKTEKEKLNINLFLSDEE